MEVRFTRVKVFLDYLKAEEDREESESLLSQTGGAWSVNLMAPILEQVHREIEWIDRRLKQNRELFPDDVKVWDDDGSELLAETDDPGGAEPADR